MSETTEKKAVFGDLEERPKTEAAPPPAEDAASIKAELERERSEKALIEEKLVQQNKARADERRINKERSKTIEDLKKQLKEASASQKDDDDGEDVEDDADDDADAEVSLGEKGKVKKPATVQEEAVDVESLLDKKLYEKNVILAIKSRARYRDEAEVLKAYVDKIAAGGLSTGDPDEDVEQALALLERSKNKRSADMPSPSSVGGVPVPKTMKPGEVPKSAIEMGKKYFGMKDEDYKKYGDSEIRI